MNVNRLFALALLGAWLLPLATAASGPEPPARYHSPAELTTALRELAAAHPDIARLHELAVSPGGRPVVMLEVGPEIAAADRTRPAILTIANPSGVTPLGGEAALHLARVVVDRAAARRERTWYIVPCLNPDAARRFFERPLHRDPRNATPVNDDQDDAVGEDGPEDLDGDGIITGLRQRHPAGEWLPVEGEPRALRRADPAKGERGIYRRFEEGIDTDGDGRINEDPPGGVDVGINFPHLFRFFTPTGGDWAGSEPESFALLRFAATHPELAMVMVFGDTNYCLVPPKSSRRGSVDFSRIKIPERVGRMLGADTERTYTMEEIMEQAQRLAPPGMELTEAMVAGFLGLGAVVNPLPEDLQWYTHLSERFKAHLKEHQLDTKRLDPADDRDGGVEGWAYYHLGLPVFSLDFWGLPVPPEDKPAEGAAAITPEQLEKMSSDDFLALGEERLAEFLKQAGGPPGVNAQMIMNMVRTGMMTPQRMAGMMRQMARPGRGEGLDPRLKALLAWSDTRLEGKGFVPWRPFTHPTLGEVEIGGPVPFADTTPPPDMIPGLLGPQVPWVLELADRLASLRLGRLEALPLGGGVHRVKVWVENTGGLPFPTAMGQRNNRPGPAVATLSGPGLTFLEGQARAVIRQVAAAGAAEVTWLVHMARPGDLEVRLVSPNAGGDQARIAVGGAQ